MKKIIFILISLFFGSTGCIYSQEEPIIKATWEHRNLIFSISTKDILYEKSDTVEIVFEIENNSDNSIMIKDLEMNPPTRFAVNNDRRSISLDLGGYYYPVSDLWFKLSVIEARAKKMINIKIPLAEGVDATKRGYEFIFSIEMGYWDFDESLAYLALGKDKMVRFRNDSDVVKAIDSRRGFTLGDLPMRIAPLE